jgi:hypothetical protein
MVGNDRLNRLSFGYLSLSLVGLNGSRSPNWTNCARKVLSIFNLIDLDMGVKTKGVKTTAAYQ